MANRTKQKLVSKKHLARVEREKRQKRYIVYGSIAIVIIVILIIGYGVLEENVLKYQKPIITVGNEKVTVKQFQDRAKFERLQLVNRYISTYQYMTSIEDENSRSIFENNLKQMEAQLDPLVYGQAVIDKMVDDLIIIQEAKQRGIEVTKKDIDKRLKAEFGYFPEGSPTPRPTFETLPTSTLSPAQLAIISPTPEITQVITSTPEITQVITETAESTATLMPTENNPGPTSTALPTATPYTEKAYQDNLKTALQNLESQIGIGEEFLRDYFEVELYRQQLRDIITEDVTSEEEQVWVRHILVSDETTAQEVLDRLENGEDFKELAKEFSIDTATAVRGGDLGWFGKGRMDKAFEKAAFSLDIGEISKPVQSSFGWHIIEALGHEMRPLTEYQYEQKRNQVFNDWIASVRETTDVVINEDWGSYVPVEPVIPDKLLLP